MNAEISYRQVRLAYVASLGMRVGPLNTVTLRQLMACRDDSARRLLLKDVDYKKAGTMSKKNRNTARLPKGPKAKPVKAEKSEVSARIEAMMRIAGKR